MSWFVYILKCADDSLYTGITNNLEKRLKAHLAGQGAKYTRARLPVEMIYHEPVAGRAEALRRENQIKALPRSKKKEILLQK